MIRIALVIFSTAALLPVTAVAQISGQVAAGAQDALQQLQMQQMLQQLTDAQTALLRAKTENLRLQAELSRAQTRAAEAIAPPSGAEATPAEDWTTCRAGLTFAGRQWGAWIAGYLSGLETGAKLPDGTVATAEKVDAVVDAIGKYCPDHPEEPIKRAVPLAIEAATTKRTPR